MEVLPRAQVRDAPKLRSKPLASQLPNMMPLRLA